MPSLILKDQQFTLVVQYPHCKKIRGSWYFKEGHLCVCGVCLYAHGVCVCPRLVSPGSPVFSSATLPFLGVHVVRVPGNLSASSVLLMANVGNDHDFPPQDVFEKTIIGGTCQIHMGRGQRDAIIHLRKE